MNKVAAACIVFGLGSLIGAVCAAPMYCQNSARLSWSLLWAGTVMLAVAAAIIA